MRFLGYFFSFAMFGLVVAVAGLFLVFQHYSRDLPDYSYLKDYQPPILTRIYADDGRMMATIAAEQRIFVPIAAIPKTVREAFISAEDQNFYTHGGVDFIGIARAMFINLQNLPMDRRPVGASTITQQVAKNMLLTNELSMQRKIREIILAKRLEESLSKDRILEIYLNEIFLGNRSYGVAAAALNYFNKSLDELTLAEAGYLAALPKAPNNYHPVKNHDLAIARRDWVIGRMVEDGRVSEDVGNAAKVEPLVMRSRDEASVVTAEYFSEEVRRELITRLGEKNVLEGGLAVKTSLDPHLQDIATRALRSGLLEFDRRQRGWRGPVTHLIPTKAGNTLEQWVKNLQAIPMPAGGEGWQLAEVAGVNENKNSSARIVTDDSKIGFIPLSELKWARREYANGTFGPPVSSVADVLSVGDVILVEAITKDEAGKALPEATYALRQVPEVQGALVAMDPHTGRVFAMSGGFSTRMSQFNRATQAFRQPGSAFKPFVYLAALDKGFTPSSLILDAPASFSQGRGMPVWQPENYSGDFHGPTPLRVGIEKSRNVMTVRLANSIGMPVVVEYAKKFGIVDDMPEMLSFALGAKETTVLRLTAAYGMIVNGGQRITPALIDRVQNRDGLTVWRQDNRVCKGCSNAVWSAFTLPPEVPDNREQVGDPRTAYQMTSILEGVTQRGTAARLQALPFPVGGKTGTTNDSKDAWFIGFTPDLVCGVFVGFDDPKPLGSRETGASVAVPIFQDFMAEAMKNKPATPFRVPSGLRLVRVNPATGALSAAGDSRSIWEAFLPDTEPQDGAIRPVLEGTLAGAAAEGAENAFRLQGWGASSPSTPNENSGVPDSAVTGTGGLY